MSRHAWYCAPDQDSRAALWILFSSMKPCAVVSGPWDADDLQKWIALRPQPLTLIYVTTERQAIGLSKVIEREAITFAHLPGQLVIISAFTHGLDTVDAQLAKLSLFATGLIENRERRSPWLTTMDADA